MNRRFKKICLHGILALTLVVSLGAAGQNSHPTLDPSQTDAALVAEKADAVLDALSTCAVPGTELIRFVEQPAMEFMMGPGECAYDVVCAEGCNAIHFSCLFSCPGPTGSPQWTACSDVCRAQAIVCVEGCCL